MPLTAGEKLGPYEILALIGKGGMGEVYRAHDPRTGRDVAIKVSAERFSERFDREVRAVAALNHPNICTLYDVGPNYLVMEFIEGESPKGPLPLEQALRIARQIGAALEEAHEKGITHRDLKPGNIKIKADGTVKVLDFGLAKITPAEAGATLSENSPTISMAATQVGVVLGTAGYMSPEQARGRKVDKRADIWAFGVVLYELVTGRRLYDGEDVTEILAKVIQGETSWVGVPPKVLPLLKSCLEKDPKNRLRDIADGWRLLEPAPVGQASGLFRVSWAAIGVLVVALGVALWAPWRAEKPVDRPLARLDVDLGADVSLPVASSSGSGVAISPDGTRLVYVSGTPVKLFTRRLDQPKATELPGTDGATAPFFSPDGQWVGFLARNKVNKISVEGGAVVPLGDITVFAGASWGEDGNILVGQAFSKGLTRIPAGGGAPEAVTELVNGELAHAVPQILPGGKTALFTAYQTLDADKASIEVVTLADRHRKTVVRGGTTPRYVATGNGAGHLIYTNKATLFAVPFDLEKLETRGTAVPILDDIAYQAQTGVGQFNFSRTGTFVYRRGGGSSASRTMTVQWVDSAGKREPLRSKPGVYLSPNLSPDGKRLGLLVTDAGTTDVWVYDPQRDAMTRLTFGGAAYTSPVWSPDGQYVMFGSVGNGMMWTRSDGASQPQPLTQSKSIQVPLSFAPDGKRLAYIELAGAPQIWTVPVELQGGQWKPGKPELFLKSQFTDQDPAFSPDGRWLAYDSNEQGKAEVWVRPFPPPSSGQGGKWQISNSGGTFPHWSRSGHDLLYQSGDQIMAVSYTAKGDTFVADKPRVWLAKLGGTNWDLAPDGKRVAVVTPEDSPEAPKQEHEVVFLQNFFDELRRKAPLAK
jgi:Tol biopolymer transport system component/predicted Ser/Thr protein kinase